MGKIQSVEKEWEIGYKWCDLEIISPRWYGELNKQGKRSSYYTCLCSCGKKFNARQDKVTKQKVKSCGCKKGYYCRMQSERQFGTYLDETGKICARCLTKKSKEEFSSTIKEPDGLYHLCLICKKNQQLTKDHNISLDDYNKLLEKQNYSCACCGSKDAFTPKNHRGVFCVDHDHKLKEQSLENIRGILCYRCNVAIGMLGDNIEGLMKAIKYLKKFEQKKKKLV